MLYCHEKATVFHSVAGDAFLQAALNFSVQRCGVMYGRIEGSEPAATVVQGANGGSETKEEAAGELLLAFFMACALLNCLESANRSRLRCMAWLLSAEGSEPATAQVQ